jgi:hypothetical protein
VPDQQQQHGEATNHKDTTRGNSFDELAKGLASGTLSRGRALRVLGGALVGGLLTTIPGVAWAACKPLLHKCVANSQCCSRNCIKNPKGSGKVCGCPTGKTLCNGRCVTNCTGDQILNPSTCQCVCPSNTTLCQGHCFYSRCGTDQTFNPVTCACESTVCPAVVDQTGQTVYCEGGTSTENRCRCETTTEGLTVCGSGRYQSCSRCCNSSSECPVGQFCNSRGQCTAPCNGNDFASCRECNSGEDCFGNCVTLYDGRRYCLPFYPSQFCTNV